MRIRDPIQEAEEPFNLIPLTDMVFNLLIFFMAATTFAQVEKEISVQLPKSTVSAAASALPQQIIININEQGQAIISRKVYNMPELKNLLGGMVKNNTKLKVILRADERGKVGYFTSVLDTCKQAGVSETQITYMAGTSAAP